MKRFAISACFLLSLLTSFCAALKAQNPADDFTALNTLKLNAGLLFVNELKLSYESELDKKSSMEFSGSYIFKNDFWYEYSDEFVLSRGVGVEVAYRRFFDKKRYVFLPYFRSYVSGSLLYKHTGYDSLWFIFQGGTSPTENECTLATKKFDYFGMKVLFGLQKRSGRFVMDLYGGMGLRMVSRKYNYLARNLNGQPCELIPGVTEYTFPGQNGVTTDFSPTIHLGIKLGIRLGKPTAQPPPPDEPSPGNSGE